MLTAMTPGLPAFTAAGRTRPVTLARDEALVQAAAPYVAVESAADGPAELALVSGDTRLAMRYDGTGFSLAVTAGGRTSQHRSRRAGRADGPVDRVALTLTGAHLAGWGHEPDGWVLRGRVDLRRRVDTHDEEWLAGLAAEGGPLRGFGQVGLRDLRVVTDVDGSPYRPGGELLLTATSAGPGFFDTAHLSLWALDPARLELTHRSDLFTRRPGLPGVYGDHAGHLVRDGQEWLLATSTWGDFDPALPEARVETTLARTTEDLLTGRHVLDTRPLPLPTTGFTSVGVWDPHLVRTDAEWLVAYVSARRFFRFHPVLAAGPSLDRLELRAAATSGHRETEGPTLHRVDGEWRVLASDGHRRRYPVLDLDLHEVGALDAPYPSNIPWPTLVDVDGSLLLVGFDGTPYGGKLVGYGSHGAVRFARNA